MLHFSALPRRRVGTRQEGPMGRGGLTSCASLSQGARIAVGTATMEHGSSLRTFAGVRALDMVTVNYLGWRCSRTRQKGENSSTVCPTGQLVFSGYILAHPHHEPVSAFGAQGSICELGLGGLSNHHNRNLINRSAVMISAEHIPVMRTLKDGVAPVAGNFQRRIRQPDFLHGHLREKEVGDCCGLQEIGLIRQFMERTRAEFNIRDEPRSFAVVGHRDGEGDFKSSVTIRDNLAAAKTAINVSAFNAGDMFGGVSGCSSGHPCGSTQKYSSTNKEEGYKNKSHRPIGEPPLERRFVVALFFIPLSLGSAVLGGGLLLPQADRRGSCHAVPRLAVGLCWLGDHLAE